MSPNSFVALFVWHPAFVSASALSPAISFLRYVRRTWPWEAWARLGTVWTAVNDKGISRYGEDTGRVWGGRVRLHARCVCVCVCVCVRHSFPPSYPLFTDYPPILSPHNLSSLVPRLLLPILPSKTHPPHINHNTSITTSITYQS